jgi:hypothetical protein
MMPGSEVIRGKGRGERTSKLRGADLNVEGSVLPAPYSVLPLLKNDCVERLADIFNDVVDMFYPDGYPD